MDANRAKNVYELMVKSRELELRLIGMVRTNDAYFWIGGPGEEAFNVALGLQIKKGEGIENDYLLFHYRNSAALMAMGVPMIDPIRLIRATATDPFSRGRTFIGHYAYKPLNIIPVTSPVETQFSMAPGFAHAQKRHGSEGITIVVGGDAGSAEADFATGMIWATRPGAELPVLFVVTDNSYGISTRKDQIFAMKNISDRAKPFGIKTLVFDGNDPEASWAAVAEAMTYVRKEKKPFMLEAKLSRLYGHSSSSGANKESADDCIILYGEKLKKAGILSEAEMDNIQKKYHQEALDALEIVRQEPLPSGESIYDFTFAPSSVDLIYGKRYFNPNT